MLSVRRVRMHSAVIISILLVVMVMSVSTATNQRETPFDTLPRNDTDVSNATDAEDSGGHSETTKSNNGPAADDADDVSMFNNTMNIDEQEQDTNHNESQCSINSNQYNKLINKLTELEEQLELLQSSVDQLDLGTPTKRLAGCPAGFTDSFSSCYIVVTDNLPWSVAGLRCQALHPRAHLVVIDNYYEQYTVADIISQEFKTNDTVGGCWRDADGGLGLWTAGQRLDPQSCSSPFVWKTSACSMSEMIYSNWCSGQPDFWRGQESCAHIYTVSDKPVSCWNDTYCDTEMCFVCEVDR